MRISHGRAPLGSVTAMLDIDDVRAFVEAAEHGTFTAAAAGLFTSQPSVSRRVAQLEREVGGELFDRSNRRAPRLSALGQMLLPHARQLLAEHERFAETVHLHGQGHAGTLTVALSEGTSAALTNLCQHVRRRLPHLRVVVRERPPGPGVREALQQREAELGIVSTEFMTGDLDGVTLGLVQHFAVGDLELLGEDEAGIEWNDLAKLPLLVPLGHEHIRYPTSGAALDIVHENGSPPVLVAMARARLGVAILAGTQTPVGLVRRPVHLDGEPQRTLLQLAWLRGVPLSVAARVLVEDLGSRASALGTLLLEEGATAIESLSPRAMHISQWTRGHSR